MEQHIADLLKLIKDLQETVSKHNDMIRILNDRIIALEDKQSGAV